MKNIFAEYEKLLAEKLEIEHKISELPKGYISRKAIGGKQYYYLQSRNKGIVESKYIKSDKIQEITNMIALRKEYEERLPEILTRLSELESAAKILDKSLFRRLTVLKLSSGMDNISVEEKEKRISFSTAMTAIEGVPVSNAVNNDLNNWKNGSVTFLSVFEQTLKRYGFGGIIDA